MNGEILPRENIKKTWIGTQEFTSALPYSDFKKTWPFKIGDELVPITGCASAFYITHYFRKELKIRPYAKWTCYSPVVLISGLMIDMANKYFINPRIIQGNSSSSTITATSLLQVTFGVGYPLLLAPVVTLYAADRLLTYPVPSLSRAPWEVYRLVSKMVQNNSKAFFISMGIQISVAAFITWHKQVCVEDFITGR